MHPRIYKEFEAIVSGMDFSGSVLEIGATPTENSLLCMKSLSRASEKVGINIDGPYTFRDITIYKGNANAMDLFEDERFDLVLCNAMLEHDPFFWKTIDEIKRVTKSRGIVGIGTPGYKTTRVDKFQDFLEKATVFRSLARNAYFDPFFTSTLTFRIHAAPGDYYRFSPQTFRDVFFNGFDNVQIRSVMSPPRIIGIGEKRMPGNPSVNPD